MSTEQETSENTSNSKLSVDSNLLEQLSNNDFLEKSLKHEILPRFQSLVCQAKVEVWQEVIERIERLERYVDQRLESFGEFGKCAGLEGVAGGADKRNFMSVESASESQVGGFQRQEFGVEVDASNFMNTSRASFSRSQFRINSAGTQKPFIFKQKNAEISNQSRLSSIKISRITKKSRILAIKNSKFSHDFPNLEMKRSSIIQANSQVSSNLALSDSRPSTTPSFRLPTKALFSEKTSPKAAEFCPTLLESPILQPMIGHLYQTEDESDHIRLIDNALKHPLINVDHGSVDMHFNRREESVLDYSEIQSRSRDKEDYEGDESKPVSFRGDVEKLVQVKVIKELGENESEIALRSVVKNYLLECSREVLSQTDSELIEPHVCYCLPNEELFTKNKTDYNEKSYKGDDQLCDCITDSQDIPNNQPFTEQNHIGTNLNQTEEPNTPPQPEHQLSATPKKPFRTLPIPFSGQSNH